MMGPQLSQNQTSLQTTVSRAVPCTMSHPVRRWFGFLILSCLLIIPFQNFGPRSEDSVEQEVQIKSTTAPVKSVASFVPHYRFELVDRNPSSVKLPDGYVPPSKMVYKSSSEDIPDEAWIKGMENRFLLKFDQTDGSEEELKNQRAMNAPADGSVNRDGKSGKTELPTAASTSAAPSKDKITWQVIDREGKGKFRYNESAALKVEANYNVSTGEGVLKVLHPLSKASQMSVEANSKNASETLNFNYTW